MDESGPNNAGKKEVEELPKISASPEPRTPHTPPNEHAPHAFRTGSPIIFPDRRKCLNAAPTEREEQMLRSTERPKSTLPGTLITTRAGHRRTESAPVIMGQKRYITPPNPVLEGQTGVTEGPWSLNNPPCSPAKKGRARRRIGTIV